MRDKDYYRNYGGERDKVAWKPLCKRVTTGGTSGEPLVFYLDRFVARQRERAYIFDIWGDVGYRPFDTRVVFRGNRPRSLVSYAWQENAYIVSPSALNSQTAPELIRKLHSIGPFFLHVYPSSLQTLIDVLRPERIAKLAVRGVLAGSEAFPLNQMRYMANLLGCQISHWYGHSEYAVLAKFCGTCEGFHFYPTYGFVEFQSAEDGLDEIIATSFRALGTRFVRYRTQDMAVTSTKTCAESRFDRVDTIVGRSQEFLVDRDGVSRAFGPFLFGIHGEFWEWIRDLQFVQRLPGRLTCRLIVKDPRKKKRVEDFVRDRFDVVDVEFDYVQSIPRTVAGKRNYFIREISVTAIRDELNV